MRLLQVNEHLPGAVDLQQAHEAVGQPLGKLRHVLGAGAARRKRPKRRRNRQHVPRLALAGKAETHKRAANVDDDGRSGRHGTTRVARRLPSPLARHTSSAAPLASRPFPFVAAHRFPMSTADAALIADLKAVITEHPDFPKPGISFKDFCPVMRHPALFRRVIKALAARYTAMGIETIGGIDSRGFVLGAPLALEMDVPLVLIRKKGKLPGETVSCSYELEYGSDALEVQRSAVEKGQKMVIIDDLLATGGTLNAAASVVEEAGAVVVEACVMIELPDLKGRDKVKCPVYAFVPYEGD